MTVEQILAELKQEKVASADAQFVNAIVQPEKTAEATPAEPAVPAETAEKTATETKVEVDEKVAEVMPTMDQASEIGRAMARAYFDELQALGIAGLTNYPAPQPATGGTVAETAPQTAPAHAPEKVASEKTAEEASTIIHTLYNTYFN